MKTYFLDSAFCSSPLLRVARSLTLLMLKHVVSSLAIALCAVAFVSSPAIADDLTIDPSNSPYTIGESYSETWDNVNVVTSGFLRVEDSGSLTITNTLTFAGFGDYGRGMLQGNGTISAATVSFEIDTFFQQYGGTMTTSEFKMGGGGHSEYELYGGTLSTGSEKLGYNGVAIFSQYGGTHTVTGDVELGNCPNNASLSSYLLRGGTYSITGELRIYSLPNDGGNGTFNLDGGTLRASSISGLGTLNLYGGTVQAIASGTLISVSQAHVAAGGTTTILDSNGFNVTITSSLVHYHDPNSDDAPDGGLRKIGSGTLTLTGANTYNGATTVTAGTLQLARAGGVALSSTAAIVVQNNGTLLFGGSNQVNQAPLTLGTSGGGGTPAKIDAGGFSQGTGGTPATPNSGSVGLGALTLASNAVLDMTGTSVLHFADSSGSSWGTATLSIYNWSGTPGIGGGAEQLLFGGDLTGLSSTQLQQVSFYSDSGSILLSNSALILNDGEIIPGPMAPVPEPSTWVAGGLTLMVLGYSQRRRVRSFSVRRPTPAL
jgi:autotransporter-associated beta strand protein